MTVLTVASVKGGVGKTSAAVNLADAAARSGKRTLLWDLDPQGAATWSLGVGRRVPGGGRTLVRAGREIDGTISSSPTPGLDVVPADFSLRYLDLELAGGGRPKRRLRELAARFQQAYDVVLVDCPPGITLAIESTLHAADAVLLPVVPASLPMRTVDQLRAFITGEKRLRHLPVLGFLSMIDRRRSTHRRLVAAVAEDPGGLLATPVPLSVDVERMGLERAPVACYAPRSRAAEAYRLLWDEIDERLRAAAQPG
jgi:cellulose biosynthesis protein BcsQ